MLTPLYSIRSPAMSQSAWKPHIPSTHSLLRAYQEPPRGDFIAYVDKLMAEQQARVRSSSAPPSKPNKQIKPTPAHGQTSVKTQPKGKHITVTAKPIAPIANLSKPHIVWLVIAFVLTIIMPPVGSVLLLWSVAKILVLKLKASNTNT